MSEKIEKAVLARTQYGVGGKPDYLLQALIIWLAMVGVSSYDFQPFLVGGFVSQMGLSDAQAGLVMAANMLGVCVALIVATLGLQKLPRARLVISALLLIIVGNLASVATSSIESLATVRLIVGLGEGFAIAAAISAVAMFSNPDRLFALIMVGMSFYGMVGLLILPALLEGPGLSGVFIGIAALSLLTLPLYRSLPDVEIEDDTKSATHQLPMSRPIGLLLVSLFILYVSMNGLWTYYARIGVSMDISPTDIGFALSAGLGASMVGGMAAAILNDRFGRSTPISLGIGMAALGIITLSLGEGFIPYIASVVMLFGGTGFTVPYVLGQLTHFDKSGRLSVVGFLTLSLGNFVGPTVAAGIVKIGTYQSLMFLNVVLIVLSLFLVIAAFTISGRDSPKLNPEV